MDSKGNIYPAEAVEAIRKESAQAQADAQRQAAQRKLASLIEIPHEDIARVQAMNRKQRRAWFRQQLRERQRVAKARKAMVEPTP